MTKHKWHDEIVAWAGGAEIECAYREETYKEWANDTDPQWNDTNFMYRIKPQPIEKKYLYVGQGYNGLMISEYPENHLYKIEVQP